MGLTAHKVTIFFREEFTWDHTQVHFGIIFVSVFLSFVFMAMGFFGRAIEGSDSAVVEAKSGRYPKSNYN